MKLDVTYDGGRDAQSSLNNDRVPDLWRGVDHLVVYAFLNFGVRL